MEVLLFDLLKIQSKDCAFAYKFVKEKQFTSASIFDVASSHGHALKICMLHPVCAGSGAAVFGLANSVG